MTPVFPSSLTRAIYGGVNPLAESGQRLLKPTPAGGGLVTSAFGRDAVAQSQGVSREVQQALFQQMEQLGAARRWVDVISAATENGSDAALEKARNVVDAIERTYRSWGGNYLWSELPDAKRGKESVDIALSIRRLGTSGEANASDLIRRLVQVGPATTVNKIDYESHEAYVKSFLNTEALGAYLKLLDSVAVAELEAHVLEAPRLDGRVLQWLARRDDARATELLTKRGVTLIEGKSDGPSVIDAIAASGIDKNHVIPRIRTIGMDTQTGATQLAAIGALGRYQTYVSAEAIAKIAARRVAPKGKLNHDAVKKAFQILGTMYRDGLTEAIDPIDKLKNQLPKGLFRPRDLHRAYTEAMSQ